MKRLLMIVVAAGGLAANAGAVPAAASTSPGFVVTMFSDPGDYIGAGAPQEFDASNATFGGSLSASGLSLDVSGGTSGSDYWFDIAPAPGDTFALGYFPGAQRTPFRTSGHPGLDISGDGRGCNEDSGAFEVRDLAFSGSTITRLDLLYEQHCEGGVPALFGQVQIGEPQPASVIVSSSSVTWPALSLGGAGTPTPVYVRNRGTATVSASAATITGSDASMFSILNDNCSSHSLAPGASCAVYVGFKPSARGPRSAQLRLPLGTRTRTVQLDGLVSPGSTGLSMQSDPGDYIGQGATYHFTPANAIISLRGGLSGVEMNVDASDGEFWTVDLDPAQGEILAPGMKYPNATRYPFNGSGNGLSVYGDGRGCNTLTGSFKVIEANFSAVDNSLQNFKATFTQHCEGGSAALTGTVKYAYSPVTGAPPGVSGFQSAASGKKVTLTWTNPSTQYYSYTVVRLQRGNPVDPMAFTGTEELSGTGNAVTVGGLVSGAAYTATAFTVDAYGNVGAAQALMFTAP